MSAKRKKRGQKRPPPPRPAAKPVQARARVDRPDDRPPAPWGSFPLVELVVALALVLLVLGFFFVPGERGVLMIGVGVALASLAGLELSIREHFGGYRSHTMLLAGVVAALVLAGLVYIGPEGLAPVGRVLIGAGVFGLCAWGLAASFRRRAGVVFKIR